MKENIENIYLRKDGRFEIRFHYGYKDDSATNYKSVYGSSEEEVVENYKNKIEELFQNNDLLIFDKNYIGYDINLWMNNSKIKNKKSTFSNYQYILKSRIIPKFAKVKKKTISLDIINKFTSELLDEGLAAKSVKDILIILQQILKIGNINIKIPMPKVPKTEIQILKKEEQLKLEKELMSNLNETTFGIYLCLYTGLRIGELCALQWKNIDLNNKKINIKKTLVRIKNPEEKTKKKTIVIIDEPKSVSSIREIPIPDFIIPTLRKLSVDATPDTFFISVTEKFVELRTFFNRYKKILYSIELKKYNFHALRHTFATRCIENGCDPKTLSEILGHSSVKITLERYVHPNYENKVLMMNQLKPFYK
jgi:integrase